jgi:hypothetical protein
LHVLHNAKFKELLFRFFRLHFFCQFNFLLLHPQVPTFTLHLPINAAHNYIKAHNGNRIWSNESQHSCPLQIESTQFFIRPNLQSNKKRIPRTALFVLILHVPVSIQFVPLRIKKTNAGDLKAAIFVGVFEAKIELAVQVLLIWF